MHQFIDNPVLSQLIANHTVIEMAVSEQIEDTAIKVIETDLNHDLSIDNEQFANIKNAAEVKEEFELQKQKLADDYLTSSESADIDSSNKPAVEDEFTLDLTGLSEEERIHIEEVMKKQNPKELHPCHLQ